MSFRSVTFPITLARPVDAMILGSRMAVADILRAEAKVAVWRAAGTGVDAQTIGQNLVMNYMRACAASRFLRGYPQATARWCFQVESHAVNLVGENYPSAGPMSIGDYRRDWITSMPGGNILVSAGGIRAAGTLADGDAIVEHEIREVRLSKTLGNDGTPGYVCQVIMSADTGPRDMSEDPEPAEPQVLEREDL